jgi:hypothetical protein
MTPRPSLDAPRRQRRHAKHGEHQQRDTADQWPSRPPRPKHGEQRREHRQPGALPPWKIDPALPSPTQRTVHRSAPARCPDCGSAARRAGSMPCCCAATAVRDGTPAHRRPPRRRPTGPSSDPSAPAAVGGSSATTATAPPAAAARPAWWTTPPPRRATRVPIDPRLPRSTGFAPTRSPALGAQAERIDRHARPVKQPTAAEFVQQFQVQAVKHPGLGPLGEPSPAGCRGAAAKLPGG